MNHKWLTLKDKAKLIAWATERLAERGISGHSKSVSDLAYVLLGHAGLPKSEAWELIIRAYQRRNSSPPSDPVHKTEADFYQSTAWKEVRYEALRRNGGRCQCCGNSPATGAVLHVDHIKPRSRFPALALDVNNLQVMCSDCNEGKGAHDTTDWRATP